MKPILAVLVSLVSLSGDLLHAQASKPRVNNEKPEKGNQTKRILSLIHI